MGESTLKGGDAAFTAALDSLFSIDSETTGRTQADITGRIGQYAHGNEPSHHVAWLYHFTGQPERSWQRVTQILDEFYTAAPDGLIGNEDCGQISSWYVLAALGLYDVAPSSRQWLLIPPRHAEMSVRFEDGRVLTSRREGSGDIARATFNGKDLERSFLWHEEVIGGGELVFELGTASAWGSAPEARPGTPMITAPILPAPWAAAPGDRFRGQLEVALVSAEPGASIIWDTHPGSVPRSGSIYQGPLTLNTTTTLEFAASDSRHTSPVVKARFDVIEHDWRVVVESIPNPQYTAGGDDALIDGRRGPQDWRTGMWRSFPWHSPHST